MNDQGQCKNIINKSILVVEDNKVNQLVLVATLKRFGMTNIAVALNGKEAIDIIDANDFDIILMDCQMPIMDGFEATQHIRSLTNAKSKIAIIAVTANTSDEYKQNCKEVGMDDFIGKPIDINELKEKLFLHLNISL